MRSKVKEAVGRLRCKKRVYGLTLWQQLQNGVLLDAEVIRQQLQAQMSTQQSVINIERMREAHRAITPDKEA